MINHSCLPQAWKVSFFFPQISVSSVSVLGNLKDPILEWKKEMSSACFQTRKKSTSLKQLICYKELWDLSWIRKGVNGKSCSIHGSFVHGSNMVKVVMLDGHGVGASMTDGEDHRLGEFLYGDRFHHTRVCQAKLHPGTSPCWHMTTQATSTFGISFDNILIKEKLYRQSHQ